ncbi:MAG TPA: HD domain-containing protein [Fimbriimonadaceae bacterium]|nr:HD domain-containing protein [Fimbriimonadaceae bacterium]
MPLETLRHATIGTRYEGQLWLVGGAVRDELLGRPQPKDFDVVLESDALALAGFLRERGASEIEPVVYPRFGTALIRIDGVDVELITARRESYEQTSRKPNVEPATLADDALRRDFTVNTLLRNIHTRELRDPLGNGLEDIRAHVLRTPLDPRETFYDDPLRMLRAIRFRWQLGFDPAPGLYEAIAEEADRLKIISAERIRDEWVKMLILPDADRAMAELHELGLLEIFAPELLEMVGVEQGAYHHLDVWNHSLLVLRNAGPGNLRLALAALLHDIGKPRTQSVDEEGHIRFFGHESVGAEMTRDLLRRLKFSNEQIEPVAKLVRNHMRFGSMPQFTAAAARRLIRDMDGDVEELLQLVEADANGLKRGVRVLDLEPIRARLEEVARVTPRSTLESPLSGEEIMRIGNLPPGVEVGRLKALLTEKVLEGELEAGDKAKAVELLKEDLHRSREAGLL